MKRAMVFFLLSFPMAVPAAAQAEGEGSIRIEKHARLTSDGSVVFTVWVACGPLPGTPDFREGHAGAGQSRTGAGAEGGLSPDIVCDGVERAYTAAPSLITETPFARGPARGSATVIACNSVGDDQGCVQLSAQRRIIVSGRAAER